MMAAPIPIAALTPVDRPLSAPDVDLRWPSKESWSVDLVGEELEPRVFVVLDLAFVPGGVNVNRCNAAPVEVWLID